MYMYYYILIFLVALPLLLTRCHLHHEEHGGAFNQTYPESHHHVPIVAVKLQLLARKMVLADNSLTDPVLSSDDFMEVINILLDRFNCSERLSHPGHVTCAKCQNTITKRVVEVLKIQSYSTLNEALFTAAAPVLLITFSNKDLEYSCDDSSQTLNTSGAYLSALVNYGGTHNRLSESDMTSFLAQMAKIYIPATFAECFDAEHIFDDLVEDHVTGATLEEVEHIATRLVADLVSGHCIGNALYPNPEEFIQFVFDAYGKHELISFEGFSHLLMDLGINSHDRHDHAGHDKENKEAQLEHSHSHHDKIRKRSIRREDESSLLGKQKRHSEDKDNDDVPTAYQCLSAEEILLSHGIQKNEDITHETFHDVCPALIQQQLGDYCHDHVDQSSPVDYKAYLYGTIFVFLITLSAALGGLIFPWVKGERKELLLNSLVALAVSTLASEALLHLIPSAFGIHSHEGHAHTHSGHSHEEEKFIGKAIVILLALYLFYLMEVFAVYLKIGEKRSSGKHPHHPLEDMKEDEKETSCAIDTKEDTEKSTVDGVQTKIPRKYRCLRYGSVPVMIILSGCLHNFADGLAIGASFSISLGRGISTGVAIVFHELSHEIGDLAVLLKCGMPIRWAIFFNILSGVTSFFGLYIGLWVGSSEETQQWILAVTAGMFFYIGLVDMLPTIMDVTSFRQRKLTIILQNVGFIVGAGVIIFISLFEHSINITL